MSLYERDFHAWASEQAALARSRSGNALDWDNVAEELDGLSKQEVSELRSRYVVLISHLLKCMFQPERQGRSWLATIDEQRDQIGIHLRRNPSLKSSDAETFQEAYRIARKRASGETDLPQKTFPQDPPFTPEQARAEDWWPEGTAPDDL